MHSAVNDHACSVVEGFPAPRLDLNLGGNQLASDVPAQWTSLARVSELFETIRHRQRVAIENLEFLFNTDRKIGRVSEMLSCSV